MLGGITLAGLGIVDIRKLAALLKRPVLVVTRRDTQQSPLADDLRAAKLAERIAIVECTPQAVQVEDGLFLASAGAMLHQAVQLLCATLKKARVPEPLRLAHLIGSALVRGESYGRV